MYVYKTASGKYEVKKWNKQDQKMRYYGTYSTYRQAVNRMNYLITKGEITPRKRTLPRHIHFIHNRYYIYKNIEGKVTYFGCYDTLEEAVKRRDYMLDNGWSREGISVKHYRERTEEMKYLTRTGNGRWRITKNNENYGTFKELSDAMDERDYLVSIDWDYGNM